MDPIRFYLCATAHRRVSAYRSTRQNFSGGFFYYQLPRNRIVIPGLTRDPERKTSHQHNEIIMAKENDPALFEVTQKAIIYDPETKKFLLAKFSKEVSENEEWSFIGGRIDNGEKASDALAREIQEEAGDIGYEIGDVVAANVDGRCRIGYLTTYQGGDIELSEEHSEYAWLTAEEIEEKKDVRPGVKEFIQAASERIKERAYLDDLTF